MPSDDLGGEIWDGGYWIDIEDATTENEWFRKIAFTTPQQQLSFMTLKPEEDIGMERHPYTTQFVRIESGKGLAESFDEKGKLVTRPIYDGVGLVIPAGVYHNIRNTSASDPLSIYLLYAPPVHDPDERERTKPKEHSDRDICPVLMDQLAAATRDVDEDTRSAIVTFLVDNPTPSDDEVHDLADDLDMDDDELEEIIYRMLAAVLR